MNKYSSQSGISLVEILVALVISLFLLGGIIQVYVGNKTTFKFTNALSEVQENGRFALETMVRDIRQAGHWGCIEFIPDEKDVIANKVSVSEWGDYKEELHDFINQEGIEGTNGTAGESDTITIRGSKPGQSNVINTATSSESGPIAVSNFNNIAIDDIVLIMRCGENDLKTEADIVHVTGTGTDADGNSTFSFNNAVTLSQIYNNDAAVIRLQTVTYSIQDGTDDNRPTLFRTEFEDAQELISGVEEMHILYGIDDDDDSYANQYVTADNVDSFEDIVSLRIELLVSSSDQTITETPLTLPFNNGNFEATDNRLYQVFSTTIALRNRAGT